MRNISDKVCRGNKKTHFIFDNVFPTMVLLTS